MQNQITNRMKKSLFYIFVRKVNIFILFLVFSGLFSCEKEDTHSNPCQDNTKIRQVKAQQRVVEEMIYTGECLIYEYIMEFSYTKYAYNAQGQLLKADRAIILDPTSCFMPVGSNGETYTDPREAPITQYSSYEYDNSGVLVKKLDYYLNGEEFQLVSYTTYEYEDGYVRHINLYNPRGELTQKHTYAYDENGNIIRDEYYFKEAENVFILTQTQDFKFDDKVNPYRVFEKEGIPGRFTNPNNIVKITYTDYYSGQKNVYTTEFLYAYDDSGLPVERDNYAFVYGE